ncbi:MAG: 16S rRNA (guanine(966)-N(2))-methyltransferase RsmD [Mariprofundaceae bacterium]|nr:16S rRNA (guanine(966)-N(2))-methyltransferase RsmD [Mariprofundaceae bacterium]
MRITAGKMRGRVLQVPDVRGLRPTSSRVREAVFNILGDMHGLSFLDLFSGSGVMALEALSRGASQAQSIEENHQACAAMRDIEQAWQVQNWTITQGTIPKVFQATSSHFDVIYADAPYQQGFAEQLAPWLAQAGITYRTFIIEEASKTSLTWTQQPFQQRKYGESTLYFFAAKADPT